eukprot:1158772-Pelagomonas_calceolata.AAC.7
MMLKGKTAAKGSTMGGCAKLTPTLPVRGVSTERGARCRGWSGSHLTTVVQSEALGDKAGEKSKCIWGSTLQPLGSTSGIGVASRYARVPTAASPLPSIFMGVPCFRAASCAFAREVLGNASDTSPSRKPTTIPGHSTRAKAYLMCSLAACSLALHVCPHGDNLYKLVWSGRRVIVGSLTVWLVAPSTILLAIIVTGTFSAVHKVVM